jgi:beta-mannosidase
MGMGHGHYVFRHKDGRECFEIFQKSANTAYTEFGVGGPCAAEELRRFIPAEELFPPRPGTSWQTHHALAAWEPNSHLLLDVLEDYFGQPARLEELVAHGQLMQQQGLKGIFEEGRRQKPRASMTLNWVFNEPWPCAANLSIVSWWNRPKPAYYGVQASLRPVLASARIPKFRWREGELLTFELWLLNDSPNEVPAGRVEASMSFVSTGGGGLGAEGGSEVNYGERFLLNWDFAAQQPNVNLPGPTVRVQLPHWTADRIYIHLRVPGRPDLNSEYVLLYTPDQTAQQSGTRALNQ